METKRSDNSAYIWIAIPFFSLALTLGLVMHNWAIGLSFGALAFTFLVIGLSTSSKPTDEDGTHKGDG